MLFYFTVTIEYCPWYLLLILFYHIQYLRSFSRVYFNGIHLQQPAFYSKNCDVLILLKKSIQTIPICTCSLLTLLLGPILKMIHTNHLKNKWSLECNYFADKSSQNIEVPMCIVFNLLYRTPPVIFSNKSTLLCAIYLH